MTTKEIINNEDVPINVIKSSWSNDTEIHIVTSDWQNQTKY